MAEININIPDELKKQAEELNLEISELAKEFIKNELLKQIMIKKFDSEEEQDITNWSVELSRKAHKRRYSELKREG